MSCLRASTIRKWSRFHGIMLLYTVRATRMDAMPCHVCFTKRTKWKNEGERTAHTHSLTQRTRMQKALPLRSIFSTWFFLSLSVSQFLFFYSFLRSSFLIFSFHRFHFAASILWCWVLRDVLNTWCSDQMMMMMYRAAHKIAEAILVRCRAEIISLCVYCVEEYIVGESFCRHPIVRWSLLSIHVPLYHHKYSSLLSACNCERF